MACYSRLYKQCESQATTGDSHCYVNNRQTCCLAHLQGMNLHLIILGKVFCVNRANYRASVHIKTLGQFCSNEAMTLAVFIQLFSHFLFKNFLSYLA